MARSKAVMQDDPLDDLERALAGVSDRLADARRGEELARKVARGLRRPWWALARTLGLFALFALAAEWGGGAFLGAAAVLLLWVVPERLRTALGLRDRLAAGEASLFAASAAEAQERFRAQVVTLLFAVPLALALCVVAAVVEDPRGPLALAAALAAYTPYLFFVELRRSAREEDEARRWLELARTIGDGAEPSHALAPRWTPGRVLLLLVVGVVPAAFLFAITRVGIPTDPETPGGWIALRGWIDLFWLLVPIAVVRRTVALREPRAERAAAAGDDDTEEDDDDESWASILVGIGRGFLGVFALYVAPLLVLALLLLAPRLDQPGPARIAAGVVALVSIATWARVLLSREDDA